MDNAMIRLTGLWQSRTGDSLSGDISPSSRLLILPNKKKRLGSKEPDFIAYLVPAGREAEQEQEPEPARQESFFRRRDLW